MVVNGVTQIELPSCLDNPATSPPRTDLATLPYFVSGPENRLASMAIKRLLSAEDIESASLVFNPLVLIGPSGSGKSHLARGIARHFLRALAQQTHNEKSIEYFSAIDFARQLRSAREEGELEAFRQRLADLSLLIVEDLHRLPERSFVQRELRDTLDGLVSNNRLILLTAQQSPTTMMKLEPSLRDRLGAGLTIQLRPPGVEARQEILRLAVASRSSDSENPKLDSDELASLAKRVDGPAPQLLRALAELEVAASAGQDLSQLRQPIQLKQLIAVVARYFSLTQAALRSPNRRKSLVHARGVVIHLARKLTDLSYAQIGQGLGRRDHTTIMHAHRNTQKLLATDPATQQAVDQLQRILTAV